MLTVLSKLLLKSLCELARLRIKRFPIIFHYILSSMAAITSGWEFEQSRQTQQTFSANQKPSFPLFLIDLDNAISHIHFLTIFGGPRFVGRGGVMKLDRMKILSDAMIVFFFVFDISLLFCRNARASKLYYARTRKMAPRSRLYFPQNIPNVKTLFCLHSFNDLPRPK